MPFSLSSILPYPNILQPPPSALHNRPPSKPSQVYGLILQRFLVWRGLVSFPLPAVVEVDDGRDDEDGEHHPDQPEGEAVPDVSSLGVTGGQVLTLVVHGVDQDLTTDKDTDGCKKGKGQITIPKGLIHLPVHPGIEGRDMRGSV